MQAEIDPVKVIRQQVMRLVTRDGATDRERIRRELAELVQYIGVVAARVETGNRAPLVRYTPKAPKTSKASRAGGQQEARRREQEDTAVAREASRFDPADSLENDLVEDLVAASYLLTAALAIPNGMMPRSRQQILIAEKVLRRATQTCYSILSRLEPKQK